MRIVHINQQDDESSGFKAAYRLHTALTREGHDSRMVVLAKTTRDPSVLPVARTLLLGGCPDVVRDGQTDVVVAERTVQALAHGIGTIMQMPPNAYHTLRHRCRAITGAEYGLETMAQAYLASFAA